MSSPFEQFEPILSVLHFFGAIPFHFPTKGSPNLKFSKNACIKVMFLFLFANCPAIITFTLLLNTEITLDSYFDATGYSTMDASAIMACSILCLVASCCHLIAFAQKTEDVSNFNKILANLSNIGIAGKGSKNKIIKRMLINTSLVCIAGILAAISNRLSFKLIIIDDANSVLIDWLLPLSSISGVSMYVAPPITGALFMSCYLVYYLAECFENLNQAIKTNGTITKSCLREKKNQKRLKWTLINTKDNIKIGLQLCQCSLDANRFLSPFILVHVFLALLLGSTFAYGAMGIFFAKVNNYRILLSLLFFSLSLVFLLSLFYIFSAAQGLEDSMQKVKNFFGRH